MILDINIKKSRKLCQELVDAAFLYMRYHNNPDVDTTEFKKTTSKKRLLKAIDELHEFLDGTRIIKAKGPNKVQAFHLPNKSVTIIQKD